MYSRPTNHVNAKRLPPLFRAISCDSPEEKAALVRSLLPGIEAALISGQTLKDIWEGTAHRRMKVSYHTFHMAVWASQEKTNRAQRLGKTG